MKTLFSPYRLLLCFTPLLLFSCSSISFYTQAARGQAEITFGRRKVAAVIADPTTEPKLAAQLRLSQELVDFAESELDLDASGSYRHYRDLKRDHVVHIVYAAPKYSLEAKTWWYLVVGSQDYRGYFKKEDAQELVSELQAEGLDTFMGGVNAYSTLGFFNDPILNTFIDYPEVDLAELIFHELTHHKYYKKNQTPFNEALAEVVAREGTRRWLLKKGDPKALAKYELRLQRRSQIRTAIEETISRLEALYQSDASIAEKQRQKEAELAALRETITELFAGWQQKPNNFLSTPLNNARLNAFTTYEALVPQLKERLASHNGDLKAFFKDIKKNGQKGNPRP